MEAIEAPEKLYFGEFDKGGLSAYSNRESNDEIEYTRTDVLVKKACGYLMEYEFNDSPTIADRRKRVEDFKNYLKYGKV